MRKPKLKVMFLAQRHRASGRQSRDLNPGQTDCQRHLSLLLTAPHGPSLGFCEISASKYWVPIVYQVPCWVHRFTSPSVSGRARRECPHFTGEKMKPQRGKGLSKVRAGPPRSPVSPTPASDPSRSPQSRWPQLPKVRQLVSILQNPLRLLPCVFMELQRGSSRQETLSFQEQILTLSDVGNVVWPEKDLISFFLFFPLSLIGHLGSKLFLIRLET